MMEAAARAIASDLRRASTLRMHASPRAGAEAASHSPGTSPSNAHIASGASNIDLEPIERMTRMGRFHKTMTLASSIGGLRLPKLGLFRARSASLWPCRRQCHTDSAGAPGQRAVQSSEGIGATGSGTSMGPADGPLSDGPLDNPNEMNIEMCNTCLFDPSRPRDTHTT